MGYRIAVASNAVRASVELMLDRADLRKYFDIVLSNQDVTKPKPDPEIYLTAAERLQLSPNQCLVLEDNFNGIQSARNAGTHLMVVQNTDDVYLANVLRHIQRVEDYSDEFAGAHVGSK
jgi:beta-phosphoglucomutase-like phosphatase (HAD superfamily)